MSEGTDALRAKECADFVSVYNATIEAQRLAEREGKDRAYVSRMVNLTTLAPDIVAAILDETLPSEVTLFDLASGTPLLWGEQRAQIWSVQKDPVCTI